MKTHMLFVDFHNDLIKWRSTAPKFIECGVKKYYIKGKKLEKQIHKMDGKYVNNLRFIDNLVLVSKMKEEIKKWGKKSFKASREDSLEKN